MKDTAFSVAEEKLHRPATCCQTDASAGGDGTSAHSDPDDGPARLGLGVAESK